MSHSLREVWLTGLDLNLSVSAQPNNTAALQTISRYPVQEVCFIIMTSTSVALPELKLISGLVVHHLFPKTSVWTLRHSGKDQFSELILTDRLQSIKTALKPTCIQSLSHLTRPNFEAPNQLKVRPSNIQPHIHLFKMPSGCHLFCSAFPSSIPHPPPTSHNLFTPQQTHAAYRLYQQTCWIVH